MKELEYTLEENAIDSLIHGIEHFIDSSDHRALKYSILHIAQAVELFLKERLRREHKLLIYTKPEVCDTNAKTVTMEEAIKRLISSNVELEEDCIKAFKNIQNVRNQIQHYKVSIDRKDIKLEIGRTLKYLEQFLENELNIVVEDRVEKEIYKVYLETVYSYNDLCKRAKVKIDEILPIGKERLDYREEYCPNCGSYSIVFPDPRFADKDIVECFLCEEKFTPRLCERCGSLVFEKDGICHDCWDNYMYENK